MNLRMNQEIDFVHLDLFCRGKIKGVATKKSYEDLGRLVIVEVYKNSDLQIPNKDYPFNHITIWENSILEN